MLSPSSISWQAVNDTAAAIVFWQSLAPELLSVRDDSTALAALLMQEHERLIYRIKLTDSETGWRAGKSWFIAPCLCGEESHALRADLTYPSRRAGDFSKLSRPQIDILPTTVGEVLADADSLKDLLDRLKSLSPYPPASLPVSQEWFWCFERQEHWNLLWDGERIVLPPTWLLGNSWKLGPLEPHEGHIQVVNREGLIGLMNDSGHLVLPCRYAWLGWSSGSEKHGLVMEAQLPNACPDESDLINLARERLNPPGIKLLAGSLHSAGVAVEEGSGEAGLKGLMNKTGEMLGGLRWRWVKELWGDRAAVQDDATGLWGYIDPAGQLVIPPRFREAHCFNDDRALFCPEEADARYGMIAPDGQVTIEPVWKNIEHLRRHYLVESDGGLYGVVDRDGQVLVTPRPVTDEERNDHGFGSDLLCGIKRGMENELRHQAKAEELWKRIADDPNHSLAGLRGLFSSNTGQIDLIDAGIWGMEVTIAEDFNWGRWNFKAGDVGTIFWQYPVSGSLFELAVEAPVMGLFGRDSQCLGVPWEALRQVTSEDAQLHVINEEFQVKTTKHKNDKGLDVFRHVLLKNGTEVTRSSSLSNNPNEICESYLRDEAHKKQLDESKEVYDQNPPKERKKYWTEYAQKIAVYGERFSDSSIVDIAQIRREEPEIDLYLDSMIQSVAELLAITYQEALDAHFKLDDAFPHRSMT